MAEPFHIILYDKDGERLNATELCLRKYLKRYQVNATLEPVACHLEISRQGVVTPALSVNRVLISFGQELDEDRLEDCARRLARMQNKEGGG